MASISRRCFFLLACLTIVQVCSATSVSKEPPVLVEVYYESLCPASAGFISKQLPDIFFGGIFDIVDLRPIPWGNALISPNGSFICQFGPDECMLNTVQACAIDVWEPIEHIIFIICAEKMVRGGNHTKWDTCFEKINLDSKPVFDCLKSGTGKKLELGYANQTAALKPPHQYVPWVVVDGEPIYDKYADFISFICKAYKGPPPPACKKESLASFSRKKTDHVDHVCYTEQHAKMPSS